jgi:hypothetical protein
MNHLSKPKLRHVNIQQTIYQGEAVFLVQDSLRLTDAAIALPQALGPLLILCDGKRTLPEIRTALEVRYQLRLPNGTLEYLLSQFDQALLLEGETFEQVKANVLQVYRTAPFRPPALAGPSYPTDPHALQQMLAGYLSQINGVVQSPPDSRGIICPHIDYQRGHATYAQVWASAAEAARQAELIIIFGTDHNGGYGRITLTRQNYASPLGMYPTDRALVNRLTKALGPEAAFAEELHHRGEHSIELAFVWLQYIRGADNPCPTVPILCGSFHHFMAGFAKIEDEPNFGPFIQLLREEVARRRTLVIAAGDLAHQGPAFDGPPLDRRSYEQMKADDAALITNLCQGNPDAFLEAMRAGQYRRNVCGLSPFYFTLSILGETQGRSIAYDRCPADASDTSYVSICGVVFD